MNRTIRFFILLAAWLMPFAIVAQSNHWTPQGSAFEDNMTLTGVIQINGVEQQSTALEVGAFCGTQCRGSVRAVLFPPTQRYVVQLTIFGVDGDQITFKLYDHNQGLELDVQSPEAVTFGPNGLGTLVNPYVLSFNENEDYIVFADPNVKAICVANWDTNGSGELSYEEAAAVTDLGQVFRENTDITSFEELQYFTGLTSISSYAFYNCTSLTGCLYIPNSVTSIGQLAFCGCSGFTGGLTIPNAVTSIGNHAFYNCSGFTGGLTIPNSVTTIGDFTFYYCSGFTGLTIPNSITSIGNYAFYNCSGFTGDLTIPNSVTSIGVGAFLGCSGFTGSLTIPNSVSSIESYAFCRCNGFTSMTVLPETPPTLGQNAFSGISQSIPVSVPCGSLEAYESADGWSEFTNYQGLDCPSCNIVFNLYDSYGDGWNGNYLVVSYGDVTEQFTMESGSYASYSLDITTGTVVSLSWISGSWMQECSFDIKFGNGVLFYHGADLSASFQEELTIDCELASAPYLISATSDPSEGGFVEGGGVYEGGTTCTLTATANTGYTFMYWTENGIQVSSDATYSFTVPGNRDLVAHFSLPLTITASSNPIEGGSVTGAGIYDYGTTCTLTATPNTDYTFIYWKKDGQQVSTDATYSFAVTENLYLEACFSLPFYVAVSSNSSEGGSVTGGGIYNYGTTCTLTATANPGYTFVKWTKYGRDVSYLSPLDLHVSATESGDYVAVFEKTKGIVVGMPQTTNQFLPSYSFCNYSLSQQIYTPDEIGGSTPITGLSFFNTGGEKTRNYDIYLVHTDKTVFSSDTDWIAVTESDRVFSGDVVMTSGYWTTIAFDTPFVYDGTSNLAVVIDDNTGSYSSGMSCRAFNAQGTQAIRVCSDGNNYDPFNLSGYGGQRYSKKNQIVFKTSNNYYTITATANPTEGGSVSGSGSYCEYTTCTLTATADSGYTFIKWVKNGEVVSYLSSISFRVTDDADYVAVFEETDGIVVGAPEAANQYLPSCSYYKYSLSQQIYTSEEIGGSTTVTGISFFNTGDTKTRNYDIYLVHTDKTAFSSDTDWITVAESDRVFGGDVTMMTGCWTTIVFDTPFAYNGISNLAVVIDDNTGSWSFGMYCRVFNTQGNQAISVNSDYTNFDPFNPSGYGGTRHSVKNQIIFQTSLTQTVSLSAGWNWFSTYIEADPIELLQMLEEGLGENGIVIKGGDITTEYDEEWGWFGDLDDEGIVNEQMYLVRTVAACTVQLEGTPANPADHAITINPGWNWIGFPCSVSVGIEDALSGFNAAPGDILKCGDISTEYDEEWGWFGDIETLEPGQGFLYYSNASTPKTLVFQTGAKASR